MTLRISRDTRLCMSLSARPGNFGTRFQNYLYEALDLDYVYKAITMTRKKLDGRVPLIGFCGAPWTLMAYMIEGGGSKMFIQAKTWVFRYPEETKAMLQKIAEACVEYLALQVQAGAQASSALLPHWIPLTACR